MNKNLILFSGICFILFFSCQNEEIIEQGYESKKVEKSNDLRSTALNKLTTKFGDFIVGIERDVLLFDANELRSLNTEEDKMPIEYAFPDKERDLVKFSNGATIEVCDSLYIFQGDMILSEEQIGLLLNVDNQSDNDGQYVETRGSVLNHYGYKWENNTIKYTFRSDFENTHRNYVYQAIAEWKKACPFLKFEEFSWETYLKDMGRLTYMYDCVVFFHGEGSYSSVGRQRYNQFISIDKGVFDKGTPMHEIGHMLGLIHEHSRPDRDNDIIVLWDNILSNKKHNYEKVNGTLSSLGTTKYWNATGLPYLDASTRIDFNSIMLYSSYSNNLAKDPSKPVMLKKKDNSKFPQQRSYISKNDRYILCSFYGVDPLSLF